MSRDGDEQAPGGARDGAMAGLRGPAVPEERPGDAACWLRRVCPRCGTLADTDPPTVCPACHAEMPGE
jgi:rubrerythrin